MSDEEDRLRFAQEAMKARPDLYTVPSNYKPPVDFPPEVLEAARQVVMGERAALQNKIRMQKIELRKLGQAHQILCFKYREALRVSGQWVKNWQNGSKMISYLARELQTVKNWDWKQLSDFMQAGKA